MMWYEKFIEGLAGQQIINDSKTPSGRVHVGSLRGVLIHDAIYRALKQHGIEATYTYGVDDYDPLDDLPADGDPNLQQYMGHPLCNIPAPKDSSAADLAEHYISEFFDVFSELGVGATVYRMRDVYRSGRFNEAIDGILKKSDIVRKVYAEVSNAARPADWHPFQVVCENCGKIGTTEVTAYDGAEVTYACKPDLVRWARGCGYEGKISPFDGNGKLPWKLEWVAKWHTFGITIEGAGKDHCTKGGSRDVAARCLQEIFGDSPPLNAPYEFFLVSGAKMSSSKGIGTAAREMANFLPPEILRFLMIRTPPKRTVNFSTDLEYIVKLFNEHDRLVEKAITGQASELEQKQLRTIEVSPESTAYHPVGFQLLTALLQLPHIEIESEIAKRTQDGFSNWDRVVLARRLQAAKYWLDNYASDEDRFMLQETLPPSAGALSDTQKAFLNKLGEVLPETELSGEEYQKLIFNTARLTPIDQKSAFLAIYKVLFDKERGPKGGALFCYLDKSFLLRRFSEVTYSRDAFWSETGVTGDAFDDWLAKHKGDVSEAKATKLINTVIPDASSPGHGAYVKGKGVIEFEVTLADAKKHLVRVLFSDFEGEDIDLNSETEYLEAYGNDLISEIGLRESIMITNIGKPIRFTEIGIRRIPPCSPDHDA
ncbi:MAG TPA: lysine--tRNA ligase [Methylococcaceae bacterium]|nr:lysine--tRNA ligase [Methylococcaceae bacterium]